MQFILLITFLAITASVKTNDITPSLRGLETIATINIYIERTCILSNPKPIDSYGLYLKSDIDLTLPRTDNRFKIGGTIDGTAFSSPLLFEFSNEVASKRLLKWDTSDKPDKKEYVFESITNIQAKFVQPNYFKSFTDTLQTLSSSQEMTQQINHKDTTKPYSFKIKWNDEIVNYILPVIAKKGTETIKLGTFCNGSMDAKKDLVCTIPKGTLSDGEWKISLDDTCYQKSDIITLKISFSQKLSASLLLLFLGLLLF